MEQRLRQKSTAAFTQTSPEAGNKGVGIERNYGEATGKRGTEGLERSDFPCRGRMSPLRRVHSEGTAREGGRTALGKGSSFGSRTVIFSDQAEKRRERSPQNGEQERVRRMGERLRWGMGKTNGKYGHLTSASGEEVLFENGKDLAVARAKRR